MSNTLDPLLGKVQGLATNIKDKINNTYEQQRNNQKNDDEGTFCPSLTPTKRIIGCLSCMLIGYILSIDSFIKFVKLLTGDPIPIVFTWTAGNIFSLAGSCFLMGPTRQMNSMFQETRMWASTCYIGSIFFTLLVIFLVDLKGKDHTPFILSMVIVLLMIVQFGAVTWYCLSYIPFARDYILRLYNGRRESYQVIV